MSKPSDVMFYPSTDCRDVIAATLAHEYHLILTDPPYFLDSLDDDNWPKNSTPKSVVGKLPVGMKFDPKQGVNLQRFIHYTAGDWFRVCRPGGFVLCFSQPRLTHRMAIGLEDAGFHIRDVYTWHYKNKTQMKAFGVDHFIDKREIPEHLKNHIKSTIGGRKTPQLRPLGEHIIMAQKPSPTNMVDNYYTWGTGLIDVSEKLNGMAPHTVMHVEKDVNIDPMRPSCPYAWVTAKPVRLLEHLIKVFTKPNHKILDPFAGSCSTAIAAANTGRRCAAIELNEHNSKLAMRRMSKENIDWGLCYDFSK